jgi:coenzyme F420-0:L-glutamate ligase/coenzyme F420-1:gamma-L-glutamate ligase
VDSARATGYHRDVTSAPTAAAPLLCAPTLSFHALPGLPRFGAGDDLATAILESCRRAALALTASDVVIVTSKVFSRIENRFADLSQVTASTRARELAAEVGSDPRLVELVLAESSELSRKKPGALVMRHRIGIVSANASIDASNVLPPPDAAPGSGPWVLLLPSDPDASARALRDALAQRQDGVRPAVLITDSLGRPFRLGTVGTCIGLAGFPALYDQRGRSDLTGMTLKHTVTAPADQLAAAADLIAGQADEGRPVIIARGLEFRPNDAGAVALVRPADEDLYR